MFAVGFICCGEDYKTYNREGGRRSTILGSDLSNGFLRESVRSSGGSGSGQREREKPDSLPRGLGAFQADCKGLPGTGAHAHAQYGSVRRVPVGCPKRSSTFSGVLQGPRGSSTRKGAGAGEQSAVEDEFGIGGQDVESGRGAAIANPRLQVRAME